jgi:hypothetical protein
MKQPWSSRFRSYGHRRPGALITESAALTGPRAVSRGTDHVYHRPARRRARSVCPPGRATALPPPLLHPQQLAAGMGLERPTVLAWTKRGLLIPVAQHARGLRLDREVAQFFIAEYVLVPEAARILEVCPATVRQWLRDGYLRSLYRKNDR